MLDLSSSCVYARALKAAVEAEATTTTGGTVDKFFMVWPAVDKARVPRSYARVPHNATHTQRKRGVFAVLCNGLWSSVVIRTRMTKSASTKRLALRAACAQLSCAKRHW